MKRFINYVFTILLLSSFTFAQNSGKNCTDISASILNIESKGNASIQIKWNTPTSTNIKSLLLYKDSSQILRKSLNTLVPLATLPGNTSEYIDNGKHNENLFYAIISVLNDGTVYDVIIPSVNATITPIKILPPKIDKYDPPKKNPPEKANQRNLMPLPYLNFKTDKEDILPLSEEAIQIASQYRKFNNKKKNQSLYVFPEDTNKKASGENYLLAKIVNGPFIANDWDTAEAELKEFLKVNRSLEITRRANFYLGQVLYYQGYYRESLEAFIFAEDIFPAKTRQWVQAVLEKMPL